MAKGYVYDPPPGPPLNPSDYTVIGPNGIRYGQQEGYEYNPTTDMYDPIIEEKKPSASDTLGPIAAGAGAIAAGTYLGNPKNWPSFGQVGQTVKDAAAGVADFVSAPFAGPDTVAGGTPVAGGSTAGAGAAGAGLGTPAAQAGLDLAGSAPFSYGAPPSGAGALPSASTSLSGAPFSMGGPGATDLASSAPFSFQTGAGPVPAPPNLVSATSDAAPLAAEAAPSTWGASLGNTLGVAGQAYYYGSQGLEAYKELQDAKTSAQGGIRAALLAGGPTTAWAAPILDVIGIKSGKHEDQYRRDAVREHLQEAGLIDENFQIRNADGSTFDIGLDGGASLMSGDGSERAYYDVDLNDPRAMDLIPAAEALAAIISGGDKKLTDDYAGYFINAAMSSGDPVENLRGYYEQLGLGHNEAYGQIHMMAQPGEEGDDPLLDNQRADAYKNSLDSFFSQGAYQGGGGPRPSPAPPVAAPQPQAASAPAPQAPKPRDNLGGIRPQTQAPQAPKPQSGGSGVVGSREPKRENKPVGSAFALGSGTRGAFARGR